MMDKQRAVLAESVAKCNEMYSSAFTSRYIDTFVRIDRL